MAKGLEDEEIQTPNDLMEAAGVPPGMRYRVAYEMISAKMVAVVDAAMKLNGGKPLRVPVCEMKRALNDPSFVVMEKVEGPDLIYSLADPEVALTVLEENRRKIARKHADRAGRPLN